MVHAQGSGTATIVASAAMVIILPKFVFATPNINTKVVAKRGRVEVVNRFPAFICLVLKAARAKLLGVSSTNTRTGARARDKESEARTAMFPWVSKERAKVHRIAIVPRVLISVVPSLTHSECALLLITQPDPGLEAPAQGEEGNVRAATSSLVGHIRGKELWMVMVAIASAVLATQSLNWSVEVVGASRLLGVILSNNSSEPYIQGERSAGGRAKFPVVGQEGDEVLRIAMSP